MKRTLALLLLATALSGATWALAAESSLPPGFSKETYIEQAAQELRQVRIQVDETARRAPGAAQSKFAPIYDSLSDAEQALAEMKSASDSETAQRRAHFEETKLKAVRLWRDFRLNSDASDTSRG